MKNEPFISVFTPTKTNKEWIVPDTIMKVSSEPARVTAKKYNTLLQKHAVKEKLKKVSSFFVLFAGRNIAKINNSLEK